MNILVIRHVADSDPARFEVMRPGGKGLAKPVAVPSPLGFPVEGRPESGLLRELAWYLEKFLEYPFSPETEHAESVLKALRTWGRKAFDSLFGTRDGGGMFDAATANGYKKLILQVWSDDPRILQWPWEALLDSKASYIAVDCQVERHLNQVRDPLPIPKGLPKDCVNILLVTARPYKEDVRYRSISRPLVELIEKQDLPAHVHVLRPPTFEHLQEHLKSRPAFYHILHFDGHGDYVPVKPPASHPVLCFEGGGLLIFEDENGEQRKVTAEQLSAIMREHALPIIVLNACRSAMLDEKAEDPFASVAAALLKSGVRGVAAMSYSLYVSGA